MTGLDLRAHFTAFREAAPSRIHLAAHSHHFWPDVTRQAQARCWSDAARLADQKWDAIFGEVIPAVQAGIARILNLPDPATLALAPNTHEFVRRILSCVTARVPRILTSDGEFHAFARQIARLEEDGLVVVERVAAEPFATFEARFVTAAQAGGHDLVFVSQVFFNSGALAGDLGCIVAAVPDPATLVVIDGYHGFMALPTDLAPVATRAFYLAGGYKYAMAGEGACFLHCPPDQAPRPRDTGWFAAFGTLAARQEGVPYAPGGGRFMGATFDPCGLYRQRAVFEWMEAIGLAVPAIHAHVLALHDLFLEGIGRLHADGLSRATLVTPVSTGVGRGHFLTFQTPMARAIHDRLTARAIVTDVRGDRIRFGFGCYHTRADIAAAPGAIAAALSA